MNVLTVEPPEVLPVEYLSLSSLKMFMSCPIKWKRRYIDKEPEPPSGKMVLGSAAGAALTQHFGLMIETGEGLATEDVLDEFSSQWDGRLDREEVDFGQEVPGQMKDSGVGALRIYHRHVAPEIVPADTEREFRLSWPGVQWCLTGYIDLEDSDNRVRDYKMTAKRLSQRDADSDLQTDIYLAARRAEGNPASGFAFDTMVRTKQPTAQAVYTMRTDRQLDQLTDRIFTLAREIRWRAETDTWSGAAPSTWFCSTCRYHDCPLRLGSPS